jgi:hypothetical protein
VPTGFACSISPEKYYIVVKRSRISTSRIFYFISTPFRLLILAIREDEHSRKTLQNKEKIICDVASLEIKYLYERE